MTTLEFSNMFDTLLNSYSSLAMFGEAHSKGDIVLDEYEKSVLLTLAQDIVVKSYFTRTTNSLGEGFDDSSRRLIDFSNLISTASSGDVSTNDGNNSTGGNGSNSGGNNNTGGSGNNTGNDNITAKSYTYEIVINVAHDVYTIIGKATKNINFSSCTNVGIRNILPTTCTLTGSRGITQLAINLNLTDVIYKKNGVRIYPTTISEINELNTAFSNLPVASIEVTDEAGTGDNTGSGNTGDNNSNNGDTGNTGNSGNTTTGSYTYEIVINAAHSVYTITGLATKNVDFDSCTNVGVRNITATTCSLTGSMGTAQLAVNVNLTDVVYKKDGVRIASSDMSAINDLASAVNEQPVTSVDITDNSIPTYTYNIVVVASTDTYIITGKSDKRVNFDPYINVALTNISSTTCTIVGMKTVSLSTSLDLTGVIYRKNNTRILPSDTVAINELSDVITGQRVSSVEIIENTSAMPSALAINTYAVNTFTDAVAVDNSSKYILRKSYNQDSAFDDRGILFDMPKNTLIILNERIIDKVNNKRYVVIPINYKEYDRQMSKAYNQPLKKLCWRLFLSTGNGFDMVSEVIPIEGAIVSEYKIRYIRRPRPIILTDLSFQTLDDLRIDGYQEVTECELNPILHMEILTKAVELAMTTRGRYSNSEKLQANQQ